MIPFTTMASESGEKEGGSIEHHNGENSNETPEEDEVSQLKIQLGGVFAWTQKDDERLCGIMTRYRVTNKNIWNEVAKAMGDDKPAKECFQRWTWYLAPPRKNLHKKRFTVEEDALIVDAVQKAGKPCWTDICKLINCNEPHRVRERWHNILNPIINHMPFSKEEDVRLYEGLKEYGQKWTSISKQFFDSTRSDIQLKNRFKTVSFQQFYAKVVSRLLENERRERARVHRQECGEGRPIIEQGQRDTLREMANDKELSHIEKRLKSSLAAQIQGEDVPKPPPGKYFTPFGAAQILSRIGKSERRSVMKTWIERNYVPVNLTSLYRALGRYNNGMKLKPRWYCEGRLNEDTNIRKRNEDIINVSAVMDSVESVIPVDCDEGQNRHTLVDNSSQMLIGVNTQKEGIDIDVEVFNPCTEP